MADSVFFSLTEKKKHSGTDAVLDIYQLEKVFSHISCYAALSGLAGGCLSLILWHFTLGLLFGNDNIVINMSSWQVLALSAAALLCCFLHLLLKRRLEKAWSREIRVTPKAEDYYRQSTVPNRHKVILLLMVWALGFAMSILFPGYLYFSDLRFSLGINAFLISLSAFCLASLLQERHIYRRMHVICASGPDDGTDYPVKKKLRNAIARWSAYWIIALGGYLTISAVFQSLSMYLGYFIIAAVFFLLRLVINNPFQRFSGIRARRIPVRLLNAVSLIGMAGLYLFVTQNGSDYNNRYIDSLEYGGFRYESIFSYDSETGVYTVSAASDEFRILQLTDIHICGSISTIQTDRRALTACYELIKETQPDLIVLTGDLVYPMPAQTFSKDNLGEMSQICSLMNQIGITWIMVYGSHM